MAYIFREVLGLHRCGSRGFRGLTPQRFFAGQFENSYMDLREMNLTPPPSRITGLLFLLVCLKIPRDLPFRDPPPPPSRIPGSVSVIYTRVLLLRQENDVYVEVNGMVF